MATDEHDWPKDTPEPDQPESSSPDERARREKESDPAKPTGDHDPEGDEFVLDVDGSVDDDMLLGDESLEINISESGAQWQPAGDGDGDMFADLEHDAAAEADVNEIDVDDLVKFTQKSGDADQDEDDLEFVLDEDGALGGDDDLFDDLEKTVEPETGSLTDDLSTDDLVLVDGSGEFEAAQPGGEKFEEATADDLEDHPAFETTAAEHFANDPFTQQHSFSDEHSESLTDEAGAHDYGAADEAPIPDYTSADFGQETGQPAFGTQDYYSESQFNEPPQSEPQYGPDDYETPPTDAPGTVDFGTTEPHMEVSGTWPAAGDDSGQFTLVDSDDALSSGIMSDVDAALTPSDDSGEPLDHDPIYGARQEDLELHDHPMFGDGGHQQPQGEYRHLERMMHEADEQQAQPFVVGPQPRRRTLVKSMMAITMAASVLILGTVAFVTLRPDMPIAQKIRGYLGLQGTSRPSVEIVRVQRPRIATNLAIPGVTITPELRLALSQPDQPDQPDKGPAKVDVQPDKAPSERAQRRYDNLVAGLKWLGTNVGRTAIRMIPKGKRQPAVDPSKQPVKTGDPIAKDPTGGGVGKTPKQTGDRGKTVEPIEPVLAMRKGARAMTDFSPGIVRGARAFAQLHNGNFFVGRVQKIRPEEVLIGLANDSEITFVPGDLQKLLPLAEAEEQVLKSGPDGYVRLKNRNKIWGRILSNLPNVVTIDTGESRIILPKSTILEVSAKPRTEVELGRDEQDWGDDQLPKAEAPQVPTVESTVEEELPAGAIRVQIGSPKENNKLLRKTIRKRLPHVLPGRK